MREVLRTHQLSVAEVARIALEAEGIEAEVLDANTLGFIGLAGEIRIAVADADYERACAIVASTQPPSQPKTELASWRWQKPGCLVFIAGVVFLIVGFSLSSDGAAGYARYTALALGAVLGLTGTITSLIGAVLATREQLREGQNV